MAHAARMIPSRPMVMAEVLHPRQLADNAGNSIFVPRRGLERRVASRFMSADQQPNVDLAGQHRREKRIEQARPPYRRVVPNGAFAAERRPCVCRKPRPSDLVKESDAKLLHTAIRGLPGWPSNTACGCGNRICASPSAPR